ncbi:uncharacterized protein LOC119731529 [Patiria miniata]|uniref:Uncharacterized protein n=1 Tax=Patiria miniata TaxID=46514 RepID=A0A914AB08_PATMI|nr:uncharacterized protein LOC119731529 [Patiria miniata]
MVRKGIAYICVAIREDFSTEKSFDFLKEIIQYVWTIDWHKKRLQRAGEHELDSDLIPELEKKMDFFSDIHNQQLWKQKYEMKDLVVKAIDHLIGEPDNETIKFLQDTEFKKCERKKNSKCGKNCKICCTIM